MGQSRLSAAIPYAGGVAAVGYLYDSASKKYRGWLYRVEAGTKPKIYSRWLGSTSLTTRMRAGTCLNYYTFALVGDYYNSKYKYNIYQIQADRYGKLTCP